MGPKELISCVLTARDSKTIIEQQGHEIDSLRQQLQLHSLSYPHPTEYDTVAGDGGHGNIEGRIINVDVCYRGEAAAACLHHRKIHSSEPSSDRHLFRGELKSKDVTHDYRWEESERAAASLVSLLPSTLFGVLLYKY